MKNHNWPIQLAKFIEKRRHAPFVWGKHDCCLFCADAAVIICGIDPAEEYRGKYHDQSSAYKLLKKIGDGTLEGAWSRYFKSIGLNEIQRGDVCLIDADIHAIYPQSRYACSLCFGNKLWVTTPGHQGLQTLSISCAVKAWRVE